ncbi:rCG27727, isoform CRA_b [Rattus norvegicus]|uniref:RCG27727, isoform CRA_b n=1 Tax=Rattus norvegicus TaxID=10116 RepID=A6KBL2_RAT|nr:rCG27727, isoform CRA_b [Rattus norvegicus]
MLSTAHLRGLELSMTQWDPVPPPPQQTHTHYTLCHPPESPTHSPCFSPIPHVPPQA